MCPNRLLPPCLSLWLSVLLLCYNVSATIPYHDKLPAVVIKPGETRIHYQDSLNLNGNNNVDIAINRPIDGTQASCQWVKVPMCSGVGYNYTTMPNIMGHQTQGDATEALKSMNNYLDSQCSPFLRLFVCSVFVPFCSEHLPGAIRPCRTLCEDVKNDCSPVLQEIGYSWPEQLNCTNFPEAPELCMQPPKDGGLEATDIQIKHQVRLPPLLPPVLPPLLPPLLHETHLDQIVPSEKCPDNMIQYGDECLTICGSQSPDYTTEGRFKAEMWIAVWSVITLLLSIFSLFTFILQPKRFRWPARPILYLTSCGAISSSVALIRWIAGPYTCSGDPMVLNRSYDSCICIGSALITTYFEIAYANWWLIFAYVWYLSAAREWSTEAIERISCRLHHYVWTSSLLPIIYVLLANAISFNTITGVCQLDSRLLTAVAALIVSVGGMLSILTTRALHRVKLTLLYSGSRPYKLDRLVYRLCVISFGICVSLLIALGARHMRSYSRQEQQSDSSSATGNLTTELVRIGGFCASACFASLWVVSAKTFRTWNKFVTCRDSGGCASWLVENKQGQQSQQQRLSLRPQVLIGGSTKV